jgi:hypothetical protein
MDWNTINDSLEHLRQPEYLYIAGAALALAFCLVLIIRRQPKNVTAYTTGNGSVMVSRSAIVELVQTSCEQIEEVAKPQVRIKVKGKNTHFEVRLKLQSGANLRAIEETLQTHLRKALSENLGIEHLGQINVVATGFKSGRVEQKSPQARVFAKKEPESESEPKSEPESKPEPKPEPEIQSGTQETPPGKPDTESKRSF